MTDPRSFFAPPDQESPSSDAPLLPSDKGDSSNSSGPIITYLKFLVSGYQPGKIIGTSGAKIKRFRERSGAQIDVSDVFFPDTRDRVVMVSGSKDNVLGAMAILLDEMLPEAEEEKGARSIPKVKLVVPKICCGALIGTGGSMIRHLISKSLAGIDVSPLDKYSERLVTVTGSFESQLKAVELILEELIKDDRYQPNLTHPFPYGGGVVHGPIVSPRSYGASQVQYQPHGPHTYGGGVARGLLVSPQSYGAPQVRYQPHGPRPSVAPQYYGASQASLTIGIHDAKIGALVGCQGINLKYIMQETGTSIKISDKGDFIPGTCNRKVTITGSPQALEHARFLIEYYK